VHVIVDLPAVRPGRLAAALANRDLAPHVRAFRGLVSGAASEPLPGGLRLVLRLSTETIAELADLVREEANALPFWSFRLLADPPACWLEVTGTEEAAEMARAVFGELGR
jgi:hypothetical protein